jgi:hypothetical protein
MPILPRLPPPSATERQLTWAELPLEKDINGLYPCHRTAKPTIHTTPTTVHSRPTRVHLKRLVVHLWFAYRFRVGRRRRHKSSSVLVEDERHFRARGHPVAGRFRVFGRHLVFFQDRVTRLVDGEQIWIHGVALRVAHTLRLLETNPHKVPSPAASAESRQIGFDESIGKTIVCRILEDCSTVPVSQFRGPPAGLEPLRYTCNIDVPPKIRWWHSSKRGLLESGAGNEIPDDKRRSGA